MYAFARIATVTKIRRFVRANTHIDDTDTPPTDDVRFGTRHGRWHLHAELGIDDGRRVQAALEESRDRQFHDGNENVTWADALVDVAERSLAAVDSPARRDSYRTWLHLDATTATPRPPTAGGSRSRSATGSWLRLELDQRMDPPRPTKRPRHLTRSASIAGRALTAARGPVTSGIDHSPW